MKDEKTIYSNFAGRWAGAGAVRVRGDSGATTASAPMATEESNVTEEEENTEEVAEEVAQALETEAESQPEETETVEPETSEPEVTPEETEDPTIDIDTSELLTTHVVEYEDQDGYTIRETCQLSPIFRESDMDTLTATWEALGGTVDEIPIGEECYNWDAKLQRSLERSDFSGAQYIVGSWEIMNCTERFDITPDSPRTFILNMLMEPDDNALASGVYEAISQCSTTCIFLDGGSEKNKSERGILPFGSVFMDDNHWGPTLFIVTLPDKVTPNSPNGYDCHNLLFDFGAYISDKCFYIPYYNELY